MAVHPAPSMHDILDIYNRVAVPMLRVMTGCAVKLRNEAAQLELAAAMSIAGGCPIKVGDLIQATAGTAVISNVTLRPDGQGVLLEARSVDSASGAAVEVDLLAPAWRNAKVTRLGGPKG